MWRGHPARVFLGTRTPCQPPRRRVKSVELLRANPSVPFINLSSVSYASGVWGSKDSPPGLDAMWADAKRGKGQVISNWKLDRRGGSLSQVFDVTVWVLVDESVT